MGHESNGQHARHGTSKTCSACPGPARLVPCHSLPPVLPACVFYMAPESFLNRNLKTQPDSTTPSLLVLLLCLAHTCAVSASYIWSVSRQGGFVKARRSRSPQLIQEPGWGLHSEVHFYNGPLPFP